jgi:surface antigen
MKTGQRIAVGDATGLAAGVGSTTHRPVPDSIADRMDSVAMMLCRSFSIAVLCVLLGACGTTVEKPTLGSLTGGLVGSKARAHRTPAPEAAALYEAWLATDLGRRLDDRDRVVAAEAEYEALETGTPGSGRDWQNPSTGRHGTVTPGAPYSVNQYTCRDFVDAVVLDGGSEVYRATACRQPDGSWRPLA